MWSTTEHFDDEDLLLAIDGELEPRRQAALDAHAAALRDLPRPSRRVRGDARAGLGAPRNRSQRRPRHLPLRESSPGRCAAGSGAGGAARVDALQVRCDDESPPRRSRSVLR